MLLELIEAYCREHSLSFCMLEREADVGNGSIGKWRDGIQKPGLIAMQKIANYTHIPLSKLLECWENDYGKSDEKHN